MFVITREIIDKSVQAQPLCAEEPFLSGDEAAVAGFYKRMFAALPRDGVDVLIEAAKRDLPAALLTGDGSDTLKHAAREYGCAVLTKPVKPASLRAWLAVGRW